MAKTKLTYTTILVLFIAHFATGKPLAEYRMWQFHKMDMDYVIGVMKKAREYDVNTVVFSHGMIDHVTQLYSTSDDGREVLTGRAAKLRKLAKDANALGLKNYIWIHELENVPAKFIKGGKVQYDVNGFVKYLTDKYEKLYKDCPEFDGILLTFHETRYKIFDNNQVSSKLSMPDRFALLINTLDAVCFRNGKDLIVRTFLYEPDQLAWVQEGLKKTHPRVMIQSKCVPHDWQPFYPHNPVIGAFPDRRLIVEFDCSSEFTGRNRIPYTSPEYFEYRWRYDLARPGVVGYNVRLDHAGYDAFYTPNEINIYAMYRLTEDAKITAGEIWNEWTVKHYGAKGAPFIEKALKPTFECVNKALFAHKYWYTDHTALPSFGYADATISRRSTAKWYPEDSGKLKETEKLLNCPTPEYLETILAEKDEAIALADESLMNLRMAKPYLEDEKYDDLRIRLDRLRRVTTIWKLHAEAFWGYKTLRGGHNVPGLRERVQRAIEGLRRQAEVSRKDRDIGQSIPGSYRNIESVADELESKLNKLEF
ncbi:MAG: hypothetical protein JXD22_01995 [Sedimentisphaerales bacterium]|nr:hypothetical protein [Sedimentisphaerales bacterium]